MPYNALTNRLEAIFNFVDEFVAGDPATRSTFDQVVLDIIAGINAMEQTREDSNVVLTLADKRYLGRVSIPPTQRSDGTPLQVGDFYNNSSVDRPNLFYIWDGASFLISSDFSIITAYFKGLAAAPDQATLRGLLGLGSAAVQNTEAFAAAGAVGGISTALQLAANGLAKTLTNWDNAHTTGPGCGFFAGDAAATNGPAVLNTVAVYLAYDANSGLLIAGTPSTGAVYFRSRTAGVWAVGWTGNLSFNADTGIVAQTGAATFAKRVMTSTDGSLAITNPGGVAGNINFAVNEANLVIPRGSIADVAINRAKLDTGTASQAFSFGSGGGVLAITLNPYCFMPSHNNGTLTFGAGGTGPDTPRVSVSGGAFQTGTVWWRYINA